MKHHHRSPHHQQVLLSPPFSRYQSCDGFFVCVCVVVVVVGVVGFCWFWETEANCRGLGLKYVVSVGPAYSSSGRRWSCVSGLTWGVTSLITVLTLMMTMKILRVLQTTKVSLCDIDFVAIFSVCVCLCFSGCWGGGYWVCCWFN